LSSFTGKKFYLHFLAGLLDWYLRIELDAGDHMHRLPADPAIDFSLEATDPLPDVVIMTPVKDQYGTIYMSVGEAVKRSQVSRYDINAQLAGRIGYPVRGFFFSFEV
jgi:hypothetical protein